MRILFVSLRGPTNAARRGGAQDYIRFVARYAARLGHDVRIVCGQEIVDGELLPFREYVDGIAILRYGTPRRRFWPLIQAARDMAPRCDVVVENLMGFPLFLPVLLDEKRQPIAIKHHFEGRTFFRTQGPVRGLAGIVLESVLQPLAYRDTPWIAVSPRTRDDLESAWVAPARRPDIVPPGIGFSGEPPVVARSPVPMILYCGALDLGRKRVDHLLEAFREVRNRLADARLVIAGSGPDAMALRSQAADLDVEFRGFVSDAEKLALLDETWVFCSPSESEGFGITWVEANARGVPVVAYELGLDTVTPACSAMVDVGDVPGLARALTSILTDETRRREMSGAARDNARRFSWTLSGRRFLDVLERELAARPGYAGRSNTVSSR